MESLGEKLRTTRQEKNISVEQVCRETNISFRYIEALENENFDVFPGEPYVIGFLKNYGAYLDLDVQKLISLYRALRIQEQPVPVEQLLKPKPKLPKFLLPVAVGLIVLCGGGWGAFHLISENQGRGADIVQTAREPIEFVMEGNSMGQRFHLNDSILVRLGTDMFRLELINLGEAVTIRTPGGVIVLDLGQEANVDLNNNGIQELRITLTDFVRNVPEMGALLHFYLMDNTALLDDITAGVDVPVVPAAIVRAAAATTLFPSSPSAHPFTLQINFLGHNMFRWEVLAERDRAGRNQRYFQRAEELNIQAQNGIRIWTSNATSARFQVIGGGRTVPVEIGLPGEVVVSDIRWVRDEDNRYRLVLIRLET